MRRIILIVLYLIFAIGLFSQTPDWLWAQSAGGVGSDMAMGGTDSNGNTYIMGSIRTTTTFGSITLEANNGSTLFIAKLDSNGAWLWAIKTPGTDNQWPNSLAVDNAGNVYLAGGFEGTIVFGNTTFSITHGEDIFVAKLDSEGNWLWAKQAGGYNWDYSQGISVDNSGNVSIIGKYDGTSTFGQFTLPNSGSDDVFVAKLDSNGNWLWAQRVGGDDEDTGGSIAFDTSGNMYISGSFSGTASFGDLTLSTVVDDKNFIAKMDMDGNFLWAKIFGGTNSEGAKVHFAADNIGNVYVGATFYGTEVIGTSTLTSYGDKDIFITKYDSSGNFVWVRQIGGIGSEGAFGIVVDNTNHIFVTGYFGFTVTIGATTLTSHGGLDMLLTKLDADGNWFWVMSAGGLGDDAGLSASLDNVGNCYVTGVYQGNVAFGTYILTSAGSMDIFVAKNNNATAIEDEFIVPERFTLLNYPNPFKSLTTLSFKISTYGLTELNIYNIRGQLVRRLVNEAKSAGTQTVTWDGKDDRGMVLASGIYLCRISSAGKHESRKMILQK